MPYETTLSDTSQISDDNKMFPVPLQYTFPTLTFELQWAGLFARCEKPDIFTIIIISYYNYMYIILYKIKHPRLSHYINNYIEELSSLEIKLMLR